MTFTTLTFVLFVGVVFSAYWGLRRRGAQNTLLIAASYVFYGWWDWRFCLMMAASSCVDFFVARRLHVMPDSGARRAVLAVSIGFNLGLLGFFKYCNFFAQSFAELAGALGWQADFVTLQIVLPVGISFYTFQTLSYSLDVYSRRLEPTRSLRDYLAFVAFFPQLVAGPIERAGHLLAQIQRPRTFDPASATDGCRQILWGMFKKLAIADRLAALVEGPYAHPAGHSGFELALATVFFAFQIYCDFSAYSDIAIGTARLFGFDLMRNFAYPYFSQSPAEFWRRWHISLSTWFRDYVYVPLGGSRTGRGRTAFNLLVTFAVSGLWHGAAWQFLFWGVLNGAAVTLQLLGPWGARKQGAATLPGGSGYLPSPGAILRIAGTFAFACLAWVFFRADSIGAAMQILQQITGVFAAPPALDAILPQGEALKMSALIVVLILVEWVQRAHPHPLAVLKLPRVGRWFVYTLLIWLAFTLTPDRPSAFIYFQF